MAEPPWLTHDEETEFAEQISTSINVKEEFLSLVFPGIKEYVI